MADKTASVVVAQDPVLESYKHILEPRLPVELGRGVEREDRRQEN